VAAGVGLDLRAVNSRVTELDQPHLTGQKHHLRKQFGICPANPS
jgi:hypothetical protein